MVQEVREDGRNLTASAWARLGCVLVRSVQHGGAPGQFHIQSTEHVFILSHYTKSTPAFAYVLRILACILPFLHCIPRMKPSLGLGANDCLALFGQCAFIRMQGRMNTGTLLRPKEAADVLAELTRHMANHMVQGRRGPSLKFIVKIAFGPWRAEPYQPA